MELRDKHRWDLLSDVCSSKDGRQKHQWHFPFSMFYNSIHLPDLLKEFILLECAVERSSHVEVEEMKRLLEKLLALRGSEELVSSFWHNFSSCSYSRETDRMARGCFRFRHE